MNVKRWIARREPNWKHLDALLNRVEKRGLKSLKTEEIKHLASLYRSVSADLARARTNQVGNTLIQSLQSLTSRSYNQIYQGSRRQEWHKVVDFYRWGFPAVVQQTWGCIAIATTIFVLGGLIGWWFSWHDPAFMPLILPESLIVQVRDRRELWMGSILGVEPIASSSIMINNLLVSFRAIAGGVTLGLFTVYVLFLNGVLIGTVSVLVGQNNLAYPFWAFVFPHGSLELPAIFLAGGAGLLIARGILFPGPYRRGDALKLNGLQAAQLVYGIVPLLVIAGVIEGFISPNPAIPNLFKYLMGTGLFVLLVQYCSQQKPQ
ncbi:stage II sporulation protein M [Leptothermofonsia sichuanensis E412]|uniref:stage II sporulation protein M n=1 Tax=Leptothermofonsia sichuanensis TaxID=2917832 RepID=UPI001CA71903|nr:stage II sporulation protein M [Leptothermofonsia sichuanensis]QZZ20125.1 stage II sporulation protein M [Leptothermofonsia sichuanensis E412]